MAVTPAHDPLDPLKGRTLGEFTLETRIGEGGFGAVYRASQVTLNRAAVVKVLRAGHRHRPDYAQRFLREAQLASRLDHPYAAHIYAFGAEADGVLWIAMELVRGIPLNNLLRLQGAMPLSRFAPLLERICEVVHAAHEQGIVHRDLKPANVMVMSRAGRLLPKLLDFGIAKLLGGSDPSDPAIILPEAAQAPADGEVEIEDHGYLADDGPTPDAFAPPLQRSNPALADTTGPTAATPGARRPPLPTPSSRDLTATGEALGSPPYMAPEQWAEEGVVDARSDIYALGVLAYQCLTRRLPFSEDTTRAIADAHARKPMPPMGGSFPREVEAVLQKALAKAKEDRYQSALDFGEAMAQAAGITGDRHQLPELDEAVRQRSMQEAPQPLAEAVGALAAAHNAHQARDSMWLVAHVAARLVGLVAIAARTRVGAGEAVDAESVSELLRQLRRRGLDDGEWVALARELCRPFARRADAYPVPELVRAFFDDEGELQAPLFEPLFDLRDQVTGGTEEQAIYGLHRGLPLVARLLDGLEFLSTYQLVVPRGTRAERWMGVRMLIRSAIALPKKDDAALSLGEEGHPLLVDAEGGAVLSLYPLLQVAQPTPGAPEELFLLEGQGRNGARLVALPAGFERQEAAFWELSRSVLVQVEDQGPSALDERAPYRGLSTFRPEDAAVFFGREREAEALVNRLRMQGMVAVVGPSGAGKSSFVQAGVIPGLPPGWRTLTVRPGAHPLAALRARLAKEGIVLPISVGEHDIPAQAEAIRQAAQRSVPEAALLIVIDQFEELFTLCADPDERKEYAELVANLGRSAKDPVRVIITLRDDFLIRADEMVALRERLALGLQLVTTPAAEDLLRILIEPARRSGYSFDDAKLPWEMVQAVVGQPGALPLLSFTASKLWELRDRSGHLLPKKAYEAMGGVGGALAQHAEQTLDAMSPEERTLVREAFRRLVTSEGTRAVLSRGELLEVLGDRAHGEAVLEKLINARLLSASEGVAAMDADEPQGASDQIEVVHEALLVAWPRLVRWRSEDAEGARLRDQLRQAAQQWAARGRPRGLLWRDEALTEYQIWRQRFPGRSTALEEEFGQASTAYALAGRRLRRALLALSFAALSVFVIFLALANRRVTASSNLAKEALAQSNEEQGRQYLLQDKPLEALVYLNEAFQAGHQGAGIRFMLGRILYLLSAQKWVARPDAVGASFDRSPDQRTVAITANGESATIVDTDSGAVKSRVTIPGAKLINAIFSPDGQTVALMGHGLWVWAPTTGSPPRRLAIPDDWSEFSGTWSADGQRLLLQSLSQGGTLEVSTAKMVEKWNGEFRYQTADERAKSDLILQDADQLVVRNGSGVVAKVGPVGRATTVARDPSSGEVAWRDESGIHVWSSNRVRLLSSHSETLINLVFGRSGRHELLSVTQQGAATLFDTSGARSPIVLVGSGAASARFSPDGARLVIGYADGRAQIVEPGSWRSLGWLYSRASAIYDVAFRGPNVLLASNDGAVVRFALRPPEPLLSEQLPSGVRGSSTGWDPTGTSLYGTGSDGNVRRWSLADGTLLESWNAAPPNAPSEMVLIDRAGRYALGTASGVVTVRSLASHKDEGTWRAHDKPLSFIDVDDDGEKLVTVSDDEVRLWNRATQQRLQAFKVENALLTASLNGGGDRILVAGLGGADVLDATTGKSMAHFWSGHRLTFAVFDPSGRYALAGGTETTGYVIDTNSGKSVGQLEGHSAEIGFGAFIDPEIVVTGTVDGVIRYWHWPTGKLLTSFAAHTGSVSWGAVKGRNVATAGEDGRILGFHLPMFDGTGDQLLRDVKKHSVFKLMGGALRGVPVP